jgi:hypothetical protein
MIIKDTGRTVTHGATGPGPVSDSDSRRQDRDSEPGKIPLGAFAILEGMVKFQVSEESEWQLEFWHRDTSRCHGPYAISNSGCKTAQPRGLTWPPRPAARRGARGSESMSVPHSFFRRVTVTRGDLFLKIKVTGRHTSRATKRVYAKIWQLS